MKRRTIYLDDKTDKELTELLELFEKNLPFRFMSRSKIVAISINEKYNKMSERKF